MFIKLVYRMYCVPDPEARLWCAITLNARVVSGACLCRDARPWGEFIIVSWFIIVSLLSQDRHHYNIRLLGMTWVTKAVFSTFYPHVCLLHYHTINDRDSLHIVSYSFRFFLEGTMNAPQKLQRPFFQHH